MTGLHIYTHNTRLRTILKIIRIYLRLSSYNFLYRDLKLQFENVIPKNKILSSILNKI